jgi:D-hexose-6-phosphate mutarotase
MLMETGAMVRGTVSEQNLRHTRRAWQSCGGVPVIFPQFASTGPLPKHGFARTAEWQLLSPVQHDSAAAVASILFAVNTATLALWAHPFRAELCVSVLCIYGNRADHPQYRRAALELYQRTHTYLAVTDIPLHPAWIAGMPLPAKPHQYR